VSLTDSLGFSTAPSLVWAEDQFGVAWQDRRDSGSEIYFTRVLSSGTEIGGDVRITDNDWDSIDPAMLWTGSEFALVWEEFVGDSEVFFVLISDDGVRSPSILQMTSTSLPSVGPVIAWTGTVFGIAWLEDLVLGPSFARFDAEGAPVGDVVEIIAGTEQPGSLDMVSGGSGFALVWLTGDGSEIYFAHVNEEGLVLGDPTSVVSCMSPSCDAPSLTFTGTGYAIAWSEGDFDESEIWFVRLDADGHVMGDRVQVTTAAGSSLDPSLTWTGDVSGLAWTDSRDMNSEVYFALLDEDGNKLGDDFRVTDDDESSGSPSLEWTGAEFAVAWTDRRDGDLEIYFARLVPVCE
jgi:hypothetical protein